MVARLMSVQGGFFKHRLRAEQHRGCRRRRHGTLLPGAGICRCHRRRKAHGAVALRLVIGAPLHVRVLVLDVLAAHATARLCWRHPSSLMRKSASDGVVTLSGVTEASLPAEAGLRRPPCTVLPAAHASRRIALKMPAQLCAVDLDLASPRDWHSTHRYRCSCLNTRSQCGHGSS